MVGGSGTGGTGVAIGSANRSVVGATGTRTTGVAELSAMAVLRQLAIEEPEPLEQRTPNTGSGIPRLGQGTLDGAIVTGEYRPSVG